MSVYLSICIYLSIYWRTMRSFRSQSAIRSSKGPLCGEKENCCVSTMWSSSRVLHSSVTLTTDVLQQEMVG